MDNCINSLFLLLTQRRATETPSSCIPSKPTFWYVLVAMFLQTSPENGKSTLSAWLSSLMDYIWLAKMTLEHCPQCMHPAPVLVLIGPRGSGIVRYLKTLNMKLTADHRLRWPLCQSYFCFTFHMIYPGTVKKKNPWSNVVLRTLSFFDFTSYTRMCALGRETT